MILAPGPLPPYFPPAAAAHLGQLLPIPALLPRAQTRAQGRRHLPTNPQQLRPRTAQDEDRHAPRTRPRRRLRQQQLQPQQRHLRLPIDQGLRPASQLDLGQRPLVGPEDPFHLPAPAVNLRRPPSPQTLRHQHVGQKPDLLLLLATDTDQPQTQRRPLLVLGLLGPVPDQPFAEAL